MQPQQPNSEQTPEETPPIEEVGISNTRVVAFLLVLVLFGVGLWYTTKDSDIIDASLEQARTLEEDIAGQSPPLDPYKDLVLDAKATFVFDINNGEVLFAQNEELQLPLASLTKLMTVYTASEYLTQNDVVIVDDVSLTAEGDSGLFANESWWFKDLTDFTLIVSSNDGANTLATAAGIKIAQESKQPLTNNTFLNKMNANARRIGLAQTYYLNETGLDPTEEFSGSYGSARDIALLLNHIIQSKPELLSATTYVTATFHSIDDFPHEASNTNEHVGNIPGLIASKTGFTDLAGGNLAVVFDAGMGHPIIIAVLGSTLEGRFTDVEKLVGAVLIDIAQ